MTHSWTTYRPAVSMPSWWWWWWWEGYQPRGQILPDWVKEEIVCMCECLLADAWMCQREDAFSIWSKCFCFGVAFFYFKNISKCHCSVERHLLFPPWLNMWVHVGIRPLGVMWQQGHLSWAEGYSLYARNVRYWVGERGHFSGWWPSTSRRSNVSDPGLARCEDV